MIPRARLFGITFVVFPALASAYAGPPTDTWFSSCESPIGTCAHATPSQSLRPIWTSSDLPPQPAVDRPEVDHPEIFPIARPTNTHSVDRPKPIPDADFNGARDVLLRWQEATRDRLPLTRTEHLKIAADYPDLSGYQQSLLDAFHGPVSCEDLLSRFDWLLVDQTAPMRLVAIPREPLDRLLCKQIEVQLAPNMNLIAVAFGDFGDENRQLVDLGPPPHRAARPISSHSDPFFTPAGMTIETAASAQPDPEYSPEPQQPALLRTAAIEDAIPISPGDPAPNKIIPSEPKPIAESDSSPFDLTLPRAPLPLAK